MPLTHYLDLSRYYAKRLSIFILFFLYASLSYAELVIQVEFSDGTSEGFNDPTSVAAVGGNTATTLGGQRRAALNAAIAILEKTLSSTQPIEITATFSNLGGGSHDALLASAGTNTLHFDFDHAPYPSTYYVAALANKLAQQDLDPDQADIFADFNADIDSNGTLGDSSWYYGLDGHPSGTDIDFMSVALHELLHGLGFISLVDVTTGKKFSGRNDIFSYFLDRLNATPSAFNDMTNKQRISAATATGFLHWIGDTTQINSSVLTAGVTGTRVHIYAPDPIEEGSSLSHFSDTLAPNNLMEPTYTEAHHSLGIAAAVLSDIGWGNLADLSVTLKNQETTPVMQQAFTLDFSIRNLGEQTANSVVFHYKLPSGLSLTNSTPGQGSCSTTDDELVCSLGAITTQQTIHILLTTQATNAQTIALNASVSGDIVDGDIANNTLANTLMINNNQQINNNNDTPVETRFGSGTMHWIVLIELCGFAIMRQFFVRRSFKIY